MNYYKLIRLFDQYNTLIAGKQKYLKDWIESNLSRVSLKNIFPIKYDSDSDLYIVKYQQDLSYLKFSPYSINALKEIYFFSLSNGIIAPKLIRYGYVETKFGNKIVLILEYIRFIEPIVAQENITLKIAELSDLCDDLGLNMSECKVALDYNENLWITDFHNTNIDYL